MFYRLLQCYSEITIVINGVLREKPAPPACIYQFLPQTKIQRYINDETAKVQAKKTKSIDFKSSL